MRKQKAFLVVSLVLLLLGIGAWGCGPAETPTPAPTFTPQPTLALPLSKYEGTRLSLLYPTGWTEIEEKPGMFTIWEPSYCSSILIGWAEFEFEVGKTSEDRYRERREATYRAILKNEGSLPQFEILHE